jgi:hypothetical protein
MSQLAIADFANSVARKGTAALTSALSAICSKRLSCASLFTHGFDMRWRVPALPEFGAAPKVPIRESHSVTDNMDSSIWYPESNTPMLPIVQFNSSQSPATSR